MNRLIRWALRSYWGLALVVISANMVGVAAIFLVAWAGGVFSRIGSDWRDSAGLIAIYPTLAFTAGICLALYDRRRHLRWLDDGRRPTREEAERLIRLPAAITCRAILLWTPGVALAVWQVDRYTDYHNVAVLVAGFTLGALESAGVIYLVLDQLVRPAVPIIAAVLGPTVHPSATVLVRVLVTWAVSAALPGLIIIVVLSDSTTPPEDRVRAALLFSIVALAVGALATWLLARSVATPMRTLYRALERITRGELDVRVPVGSASEIGRLEHSVNELATTLRDRLHTEDVFGRHVGSTVAERALSGNADLTGDVRIVSALFVDVTGSVQLSAEMAPEEFVHKLNRLLATVVAATEDNGGLVNKFAGDAALCIFGAPSALHDNATPALRAARRIRDEVVATGELDIGIGVARGRVFAGDVGADTRLEFTVIGDAVNEAARLTAEAKDAPRRILVSTPILQAATPHERAKWKRYKDIRLRGISGRTRTWTDLPPVR
ncbi:adenylate/guanylate cyclase domain-containing protein [Nocardia mangyaensis]|uniref:adenylate/guanylate cyclase domain-containing protein n=1 Tax=Nocardia mangyaensis TaxID=2213200 RepID=UPI0026762EBB|nr:adenylate/guanylate cyclase domain-containing protein [Nocardia mangyaensis]MDO3648130.1 adenylate/guanylate cyclase domain-containing protein [Nocardia mangyaensis]